MTQEPSARLIKVLVLLTFAAMITVNALANILPINGLGTGDVSDSYPNLFAPAGLTFAIWGVIYVLLAGHTLYQLGLFRTMELGNDALLLKVGRMFALTSLANSAWIFAWHYRLILLSMILMLILLFGLMYIATAIHASDLTGRERLFVRLPFSVYFGWITVATIANATTLLVDLKWDGFGIPESTWTIIILVVGALIGSVTALRLRDFAYGLVLIWAYAGIMLKHVTVEGFAGAYPDVIITVGVCLGLFVAVDGLILLQGNHQSQTK